MFDKVNDAIILATNAHKDQVGKLTKRPYVFHPIQVASIISSITDDEDLITAGVLHDVVEDAGISPEQIRKQFGERVCNLVISETENKHKELSAEASWEIRKRESLEELKNANDIGVKILWLSDKLANARSIYAAYLKEGNQVWTHFHQKDPKMHKWYYESVLAYTKELSGTAAYKNLKFICSELFDGE